jgi:hypothetical protein
MEITPGEFSNYSIHDTIVWILGGLILGVLVVEGYRAKAHSPVRTASLEPREPVPKTPMRRYTWVALTMSVLCCVLGLVMGAGWRVLVPFFVSAVLVGLSELTLHAIADRPRPDSESGRSLDRRFRRMATLSVIRLGAAAATLGLGYSASFVVNLDTKTIPGIDVGDWSLTAFGIATTVATTVLVISSMRVRPEDF